MRTLWRVLVRTLFWSFERGTWPYDVAVGLIVIFVLLSPRSWFNDRPPMVAAPAPATVDLRGTDPQNGVEIYRVSAQLLSFSGSVPEPELEHQLHDVVRKYVKSLQLHNGGFEIVRIAPVRGTGGVIVFYDVSVKP
jgi:hypothetical protein